ncbi:MAG: DUF6348 family protein [Myxococcota bacterium]
MRTCLTLTLLAACSGGAALEPKGPNPQASAMAAERLCFVFQHAGETCRASQDLVEVGERTLKVEATIVTSAEAAGLATRYVAFEVDHAGKTAMHPVRIMGKGAGSDTASASEAALARAAQDWAALAGTALVDSIRDSGRSEALISAMKAGRLAPKEATAPPSIAVAGFHAYPGIVDLRGTMQGGPSMDHPGLLQAMDAELAGLDPGQVHTLLFTMRNDGSVTCESAEVDGVAFDRLCPVIASFGWPTPSSPYGLKQAYVLVPGAPPAVTPDPVDAGSDGADAPPVEEGAP